VFHNQSMCCISPIFFDALHFAYSRNCRRHSEHDRFGVLHLRCDTSANRLSFIRLSFILIDLQLPFSRLYALTHTYVHNNHTHTFATPGALLPGGEDKNTIFGEILVFDVVTNRYQTLVMPSGVALPRERKQHISFTRCLFFHFRIAHVGVFFFVLKISIRLWCTLLVCIVSTLYFAVP
jgi:hypothetical protein